MTIRPTRDAVLAAFATAYPNIDPYGLYCSVTGKLVGSALEVDDLIRSLPGDAEDMADDIAMRLFASMRPGLFWNKMRSDTLNQLRKERPVELLAYLLNRAFQPLSGGNPIVVNHDRIKTFTRCATLTAEQIGSLTYLLLEIDSKNGLTTVYPTFRVSDFLSESFDIFMSFVTVWHGLLMKEHDKMLKTRELETRWWRSGNALAKPAFFSAFMESAPKTERAQARSEKQADSDFMANFLSALTKDQSESRVNITTSKPAMAIGKMPTFKRPNTKMPMFGAKRESQA